jgi:putative ABC transport system permease protein
MTAIFRAPIGFIDSRGTLAKTEQCVKPPAAGPPFKMIYGDRTKALTQPQTLILSKRKADKLYPGVDPVGRQVILNDDKDHPWTIGGVMQDPPEHTHLQFDYYLSLTKHGLWQGEQANWLAGNYDIYLLIRSDADADKLSKRISQIKDKYWVPAMQKAGLPNATTAIANLGFKFRTSRG